VKTRADVRLREEAARFAFRFACDDCVHFDLARARCAHGYPAAPRQDALATSASPDDELAFCKEFELA
jgi:hypothetical protein